MEAEAKDYKVDRVNAAEADQHAASARVALMTQTISNTLAQAAEEDLDAFQAEIIQKCKAKLTEISDGGGRETLVDAASVIVARRDELRRVKDRAAAMIQAAEKALKFTEDAFLPMLEWWAKENLKGRAKTVTLDGYKLAFRKVPGKIDIKDLDAAVDGLCEKFGAGAVYDAGLVRTKTEIQKTAAKKYLLENGKPEIDGIVYVDASESFSLKEGK